VKVFRLHRSWALLPAIVWLAMQLAMAAGGTANAQAGAGKQATADLSPLVSGLEPSLWLCGPNSNAPPDGGDAPAANTDCYWCQAFGSMPEPVAPPAALPDFAVAVLANQPFAEPGHSVISAPNTGFRSRAPPL
jgi:hypothetical protein